MSPWIKRRKGRIVKLLYSPSRTKALWSISSSAYQKTVVIWPTGHPAKRPRDLGVLNTLQCRISSIWLSSVLWIFTSLCTQLETVLTMCSLVRKTLIKVQIQVSSNSNSRYLLSSTDTENYGSSGRSCGAPVNNGKKVRKHKESPTTGSNRYPKLT